jgi:hypothetical protein
VSFLSNIITKIQPLLNKTKGTVRIKLLNTTNSIIGIVVSIFTLIVYSIDVIGKNNDSEKKDIETVYKKDETKTKGTNNNANYVIKPKSPKTKAISPKKIIYFNTNEYLLKNNSLALFITNSKNNIHSEFQQKLSANFQLKNIQVSTSFFTNKSSNHFNNFYSANQQWLETTEIQKHIYKYLIGTIKINKSVSSEDRDISIINLTFQGKIVNIKTKKSLPITKNVRETSYQEFKAFEDAYNRLCQEIVKSSINF